MDTDIHSRTEMLLDRSTDMINCSVSLLYDGRWSASIARSFHSARLGLAAVLLSYGTRPGRAGLARMIGLIERKTGSAPPQGLLVNARRLDRVFLQIIRNTAVSRDWSEFPDEEMSVDMLHVARLVVRFCRGRISRLGSHNGSMGEAD